ncbi:TPA: TIR domain-containing protein [Clostridium botulinum]|nr:TIR domain-containing protein [Clostridium botulinum]
MINTYNLFISHAWDYNSDYYSLINKLNAYPYFSYKNYSVPEHDALDTNTNTELYESLKKQIAPTSVVLIIAGMYYNHREWIQKEINIAKAYNKPIIAIRPWGAEKMPTEVSNEATVVVNWNIDSIVQAIRNYSI